MSQANKTTTEPKPSIISTFFAGLLDLVKGILNAILSLLSLVVNTVTTLVPSTAFTSAKDEGYSAQMRATYLAAIDKIQMSDANRQVLLNNWLEQINWANSRANRERNANEIIRWWQIVLGVLIPTLTTQSDLLILGISTTAVVGFMGIFVAFLTGISQFRRPDENWRHYRILSENYQNELWDFITLSGENYRKVDQTTNTVSKILTYDEAFTVFHQRMTRLRKEDVSSFFKETASNSRPRTIEELKKEMLELQQLQTGVVTGNFTTQTVPVVTTATTNPPNAG